MNRRRFRNCGKAKPPTLISSKTLPNQKGAARCDQNCCKTEKTILQITPAIPQTPPFAELSVSAARSCYNRSMQSCGLCNASLVPVQPHRKHSLSYRVLTFTRTLLLCLPTAMPCTGTSSSSLLSGCLKHGGMFLSLILISVV